MDRPSRKSFVIEIEDTPVPDQKTERSRFILLHNSLTRALWDCLILLATFYIAVSVPYEVSFLPHEIEDRSTLEVDVVAEVLFVLDIILNFRTTYQKKSGQTEYNARAICVHYLRTWFFIDMVAALPVDLLHVLKISVSHLIHLLKSVRLLRLLRLLGKLDRYAQNSALVLTTLMSVYVLLAHWMACIWYLIALHDLHNKYWHASWLFELSQRLNTPYINGTLGGPSSRSCYITALYYTISILTTVGFGNVSANTNPEKIFTICVMLIGALLHALIFANVIAIIQRMYARRSKYHKRMTDLTIFSNVYRLPKEVRNHLLEYVDITLTANHGINVTEVLNNVPDYLCADINMHLYKDMLHLPVFKEASVCCLRLLSSHIRTTFCFPGQFLCFQGEVLNDLHFVRSGSLLVLNGKKLLARIESGSLIGSDLPEPYQIMKTNAVVKAFDHCYLLSLRIQDLRQVIEYYPELGVLFNAHIREHLAFNLREGNPDQCHCGYATPYDSTMPLDHISSPPNICRKLTRAFQRLSSGVTADKTFLIVQQDFQENLVPTAMSEDSPTSTPSSFTCPENEENQPQLLTDNQRLSVNGQSHHSHESPPGYIEDRKSTRSHHSN